MEWFYVLSIVTALNTAGLPARAVQVRHGGFDTFEACEKSRANLRVRRESDDRGGWSTSVCDSTAAQQAPLTRPRPRQPR